MSGYSINRREENEGVPGTFPQQHQRICAPWGVGGGMSMQEAPCQHLPSQSIPQQRGARRQRLPSCASRDSSTAARSSSACQCHDATRNPIFLLFCKFQSSIEFFTIQSMILIMKVVICNSNIYTGSSFSYVFLHKVIFKSKCGFHFIQL